MQAERALLRPLGWDEEWERLAPPGAPVGRVVRVDRGECDVVTPTGRVRARAAPERGAGQGPLATGDWVVLSDRGAGHLVVEHVLPRRRVLVRRDPAETIVDQVLVANVDRVLLVHGLDRPLAPGLLERFLVQAWDSGAEPGVVLTKRDLVDGVGQAAAVLDAVAPGLAVVTTSVVSGEGLDALGALIGAGDTVALLGASGTGKSTLVNALVGAAVQAVGAVRVSDARGRHTTTARELVPLAGGGSVIDTPGIRAVGLWAPREALDRVFADIVEAAEACRFSDCRHDQEPGCAVRDRVDPRRLSRYRALVEELREVQDRQRGHSRDGATQRRR